MKGIDLIKLKYHDDFNLIEPGYIDKAQFNLKQKALVYRWFQANLKKVADASHGWMILKGKDLLYSRMEELVGKANAIIALLDEIDSFELYNDAKTERENILMNQQAKIVKQKRHLIDKINALENSKTVDNYGDIVDKQRPLKNKVADCEEDVARIEKLRGKDYNEY